MAIWLPRLAIDRWRLAEGLNPGEGADAHPLALIAETAHGPRITAANDAGLAAGAEPGKMLADARAICPKLAVAPADRDGDLNFLESLALWTQRWGPWAAIDPPDGVIVDVTGVAHLFGGETRLLADARARFRHRRLRTRFAIAPTAGAAWAMAHYGPENAIVPSHDDALSSLAGLPVAALRLASETVLLLRRLGLKRIGDLVQVERQAFARRFRNLLAADGNPLIRLDQLFGRVAEPLLPVEPIDRPIVQRRLVEPIRHRELLDRLVADLVADMGDLLEARAMGARRLSLGLWKVDGEIVSRDLELGVPSRDAGHITRLYGHRLDGIDAGFGIEFARLQASWSEPLALSQRAIGDGDEREGTTLAVCLDRMIMRLGAKAVRHPMSYPSHIPERAQRWHDPFAVGKPGQAELEFHAKPLKLLDRPEPIQVTYALPDGAPRQFRWRNTLLEVVRSEGPERLAPEWWRERLAVRLRDYFRIEDRQGRRYWIYRAGVVGDGRGGIPEWFLQGLFG